MSEKKTKRCGTCKRYESTEKHRQSGRCNYNLPAWVTASLNNVMDAQGGKACPTWEAIPLELVDSDAAEDDGGTKCLK